MNVTDALGWTLIHFLWQGALIALFYRAVGGGLSRAGANARYLAACTGLLLMAVTPLATFVRLAIEPAGGVATKSALTIPIRIAAVPTPIASGELPRRLRDSFPLLITVWLMGVSLLSAWSALGWFGALRLKRRGTSPALALWQQRLGTLCLRMGIRRRVRLLESTLVRVPSVIGLIRPVVLIPAGAFLNLPARHVEALLAHELAHIRRHDYLVNLLQTVVETMLFYHPAVWWVSQRIRVEREHCSDDLAVAACGDRLTYARALTGLEEMRIAGAGYAIAANGASLVARIRRLTASREAHGNTRGSWILAALPLLIGLTMWASPGFMQRDHVAQATTGVQAPSEPAPARQGPERSSPARKKKTAAVEQPSAAHPVVAPAAPSSPKGSGFLAALAAAGYGDLSVDEIIELKNHGVTGDFLMEMKDAGFGHLSPKQLIDLRVQGVNPEYVRQMHESGIRDLTIKDVTELRGHGVNSAHLKEIHSLGFGPYTAREAIDIALSGVRPDLFRALRENGFRQIAAREAVEAQMNGLRASDLQEARKYGSNLSLKQILKLKQAGVL